MIVPGVTFTDGRIAASVESGVDPTNFHGGFGFMADGTFAIDTAAPAGSASVKGYRMSSLGAIYGTTATAGSDSFIEGVRVSAAGQVVYANGEDPPAGFTGCNPVDANGVLQVVFGGAPAVPTLLVGEDGFGGLGYTDGEYGGLTPELILGYHFIMHTYIFDDFFGTGLVVAAAGSPAATLFNSVSITDDLDVTYTYTRGSDTYSTQLVDGNRIWNWDSIFAYMGMELTLGNSYVLTFA